MKDQAKRKPTAAEIEKVVGWMRSATTNGGTFKAREAFEALRETPAGASFSNAADTFMYRLVDRTIQSLRTQGKIRMASYGHWKAAP